MHNINSRVSFSLPLTFEKVISSAHLLNFFHWQPLLFSQINPTMGFHYLSGRKELELLYEARKLKEKPQYINLTNKLCERSARFHLLKTLSHIYHYTHLALCFSHCFPTKLSSFPTPKNTFPLLTETKPISDHKPLTTLFISVQEINTINCTN